MSNYLKRISADEKELKSAQNVLAEAHARASVEQKVSGLKAKAATLAAASESALGAKSFNIETVMNLAKETEENKAALALAQGILASEFGAE
jgi:hypothetical protein